MSPGKHLQLTNIERILIIPNYIYLINKTSSFLTKGLCIRSHQMTTAKSVPALIEELHWRHCSSDRHCLSIKGHLQFPRLGSHSLIEIHVYTHF